jgi:hypothetical protein
MTGALIVVSVGWLVALVTSERLRARAQTLQGQLDVQRARAAAEQAGRERSEAREVDLAHRFADELASFRAGEAQRVSELLDRIQAPQLVVPGEQPGPDDPNRKLHWSEDDELQGVHPSEIAAAARLVQEAEALSPYIDELAQREGA